MSKHNVKLTLVEMYAIKHGLEKALPGKKIALACAVLANSTENIERFQKDIIHEEALIKRFEHEISEYKESKRIK